MGFIERIKLIGNKKQKELARKREAIRRKIIQFFEKKNKDAVSLPAFIMAHELMKYYCRTDKQIEYYYENMTREGAQA